MKKLSKKRRQAEIQIGIDRQNKGKHPPGWFPDYGVRELRLFGASLAKAGQARRRKASKKRR